MKPRHLVLGVALIGAAALAALGDRSPGAGITEAVERPSTRAALPSMTRVAPARRVDLTAEEHADGDNATATSGKGETILALVPRDALIGDSDVQFAQSGHGASAGHSTLFGHQDWTPPPPPPAPAPPPAAPSAPPLPFTFIGKAVADGTWEVYLAQGARTYVVHDKDLIDGTYQVEAIAPPVMSLTYLPLKQTQQLNIGVFE